MFFVILLIPSRVFPSDNYQSILLGEVFPPNEKVLKIAEKVLNEYKNYAKEAWGADVSVYLDKNDGKIYTNWHKVHKGEIEWKIEIAVSRDLYRIDVWERPTFSILKVQRKGRMARLEEWSLQYLFEQLLIDSNK